MIGFDNERYLKAQAEAIRRRVDQFAGKLYLEFGGKILQDLHAARVLPGYDPDVKIKLLDRLKDFSEIIFCINAADIEKGRIRGDFGLTYDQASLRTFDDLEDFGFAVAAVVVTRHHAEKNTARFIETIRAREIPVYTHTDIPGYPYNVATIVSNEGYGKLSFIETSKPLVIVTGAGPGSGKMSTCLAQVYHHHLRGQGAGYAKFETFPIWNLPLEHPVNLAYEAATADLKDINMIDPFHLEAYGVKAINYNRDIENFRIVREIIQRIRTTHSPFLCYRSPTDMGVNTAKEGIIDDQAVCAAAKQEIIRRYFRYNWEVKQRLESPDAVAIVENLMQRAEITIADRRVVGAARTAAEQAKQKKKGNRGIFCGAAIGLADDRIVAGMNTPLLHAESAAVLNALKTMADIPEPIDLLSENIIGSIVKLKEDILRGRSPSLNVEEVLIALAISSASNPTSAHCMERLKLLDNCEMHSTHVVGRGDESGLRKLHLNLTTDALPTTRGFFY